MSSGACDSAPNQRALSSCIGRVALLSVCSMVACGQATDEPSSQPVALDEQAESLVANPYPNLHDGTFVIHGLGTRCIDSGVQPQLATQVTLKKCNGGSTQNIRVRELDATSHDVALMVPGSPFCLGLGSPPNKALGMIGAKLDLQKCDDSKAAQRFAFDGDAILAGNQKDGDRVSRELVIELEAGNTNVGTRLVAGARDVSDAEYFTMVPTDGSNRKPTSAFVQVATAKELEVEMAISSWGSVIEVTQSMTLRPSIHLLHAGATLRGARAFAEASPEIHYAYGESEATPTPGDAAITVEGNTRVTDLAVRGPTNADDDDAPPKKK